LTGAAFIFSEHFSDITLAADYRLDQQFSAHPWGNNSATNPLFNDGTTFLRTDGDDVARSAKTVLLSESEVALDALSFCVDYKFRPNNCGRCSKCTRTKLMFLAATGTVPDIFVSSDLETNAISSIQLNKKSERAFFTDLYSCAKENDRLATMPYLENYFDKLRAIDLETYSSGLLDRLRKLLTGQ